jgi:predicted DNA-binding transcriptional regulator YafY
LNKNEEKKRLVTPYAVYFDPDGATLKLVAFEPSYGEIRVFSIDRILSAASINEKFTRPADFSLQNYLEENCFNGIHGSPVTVRLRATGLRRESLPSENFARRKNRS